MGSYFQFLACCIFLLLRSLSAIADGELLIHRDTPSALEEDETDRLPQASGSLEILQMPASAAASSPFLWGVATSAYQIEGCVGLRECGRGPSIWDTFEEQRPSRIANNDSARIAADSVHRYQEDVDLLRRLGVKAYRFSISWSRIFPQGRGHINLQGVNYYNHLIDALIDSDIEPVVTLYHWDMPQALEDEYGGWLNSKVVDDFVNFASLCFERFGDRVKMWITLNEPHTFIYNGYVSGLFAPGRCSDRSRCAEGDSATEGYIVARHALLAHSGAVAVYRMRYNHDHKGSIGITLNMDWGEPLTSSPADIAAAARRNEFQVAWFADPIYFGRYPESMVKAVGDRLPPFSEEEAALLKGSSDFLGMNHYSTHYYSDCGKTNTGMNGWTEDMCAVETNFDLTGRPVGVRAESTWLYVVPWGFYKVLRWNAERYGNPGIYVTENGVDAPGEAKMPLKDILNDQFRIDYFSRYLEQLQRARRDGIFVRGYFAWSLLDNFEWVDGYEARFGICHVNYSDPLRPRTMKQSAYWYRDFIAANRLGDGRTRGGSESSIAFDRMISRAVGPLSLLEEVKQRDGWFSLVGGY